MEILELDQHHLGHEKQSSVAEQAAPAHQYGLSIHRAQDARLQPDPGRRR
jgi:hypothetical protein